MAYFIIALWITANLDHPDSEADSIAELLASEELLTEDLTNVANETRWLLLDALEHDFARSKSLTTLVQKPFVYPEASCEDTWLRTLHDNALIEKWYLAHSHQAREAYEQITFDIPLADHRLVDMYIDYFTGRGRWFFARWLSRSARYIPIMQPILREKGMPEDLVYLAMIESGFSAKAISTAAAGGFWQFIPSTGRLYKLQTDVWVDERRDFVRATEAAADYLSFLYREFGDWHLAFAGYNAGEGRVRRALAKYNTNSFWELIEYNQSLVKETQHYVPKIIAAAIIAKNMDKYGFSDVELLSILEYDEFSVTDATDISAVARKFNINVELLRDLNPSLLHGITPPGKTSKLRVPKGHGQEVADWLTDLPREKRLAYAVHHIQSGENLSVIAKQYGTSIEAIRDFNHITNVRALRVGQTLIIPSAGAGKLTSMTKAPASFNSKDSPQHPVKINQATSTKVAATTVTPAKDPNKRTMGKIHVVAQGDTFWSIAQRYGTTVEHLKRSNQRRSNHLGIGDILNIP